MSLYYECHVTIEPVFDIQLENVKKIATCHKFKVADLLMKKQREATEERSEKDTFMTSHSQEYNDLFNIMCNVIRDLKDAGFKVWRYKIEDIIIDSRKEDEYNLLGYNMIDVSPIWRNGITNTIAIVDLARKYKPDQMDEILDRWFKQSRHSKISSYKEAEEVYKNFVSINILN